MQTMQKFENIAYTKSRTEGFFVKNEMRFQIKQHPKLIGRLYQLLTDFELMMTQLFSRGCADIRPSNTIANKKTIISSNGEEILSCVLFNVCLHTFLGVELYQMHL